MATDNPDPKVSEDTSAIPAKPASVPRPAGDQAPTIRYVDRPDLEETFADSITGLIFDGQMLRIEFAVTRLDEVKANKPVTGRRYPASRLVLPPAAAVDLINRMQQIGAALTRSGVAKATQQSELPKATQLNVK